MSDINLQNNPAIDSDRSTVITIAGQDYALLLTTRATKEIARRYGGLQNLGDKLFEGKENFDEGLDEIIWLITLLVNQSVLIHNFQFPDDQQELLDAETLELLTSPYDLLGFKEPSCPVCPRARRAISKRRKAPQTLRSRRRQYVRVAPVLRLLALRLLARRV